MRRRILTASALASLAIAAPSAAQLARTATIHVSPASGTRATRFVVSFTTPEAIGTFAGINREDLVNVSHTRAYGCIRSATLAVPAAAAGAAVRVTLNPARLGGHWCVGVYVGQVESLQRPICGPAQVCPAFVLHRGVVGRFTFRIRAAK